MKIAKVDIRNYTSGSVEVVEAIGEIDVLDIDEFKQSVKSAADTVNDLVIDLRRVNFIDSAGLEVLISIYIKRSKQTRPFAILVRKGSQPDEVLHIVYFHTLAKITSDPTEVGLEV